MGKASRLKRERRFSGEDGGFIDGQPVDAELKPRVAGLESAYAVNEMLWDEMVRWKLSTPQPEPGEPGASAIMRRVRAEGAVPVMVNRGPAGIPEAVVWVCPGCGNTWTRDIGNGSVTWKRAGHSDLEMSFSEPLVCVEMTEGRCPSSTWTLRDGRLAGAEFID